MNILALSGSLQTASSNSALARLAAAHSQSRDALNVRVFTGLAELPYFNPDLDGPAPPGAVAALRARVGEADALLICSPEYAHEMPGLLKNALDWLVSSGELYDKPIALLCAAPNANRGRYVREALQRTLHAQGARVVTSTTVAMPPAKWSEQDPAPEVLASIGAALDALIASTIVA